MSLTNETTTEITTLFERERIFGAMEMLTRIRGSILGYPNLGGDKVIMKKVEALIADAYQRGAEDMLVRVVKCSDDQGIILRDDVIGLRVTPPASAEPEVKP